MNKLSSETERALAKSFTEDVLADIYICVYIYIYIYIYIYKIKDFLANILSRLRVSDPLWQPHQLTVLLLLLWFIWNRFLCMQCPKTSFFLFKDGADLIMDSFLVAKFAHFISWCEWLQLYYDLLGGPPAYALCIQI